MIDPAGLRPLGKLPSKVSLVAAQLRLTVNQSLERVKGKTVFKSPKTKNSRRTITLPALTIEALKEHRAAQAAERLRLGLGKSELVFAHADGSPFAFKDCPMSDSLHHEGF